MTEHIPLWRFCGRAMGFSVMERFVISVVDEAGNQYALKDCWVTEEKRMHETTILEMVKGIPNVVQLVDHWDVYYEGEPDSTAHICSQYDIGHQDDLMFRNRFHHRILLSPFAHYMMIENPNNFVVHEGIGYFINFDHASILEEGKTSTYLHGTGTMPYISICILQAMLDLAPLEVGANIPGQDADLNNVDDSKVANNVDLVPQAANALQNVNFDTNLIEHRPSDDLESLFYIFFEFIAKYGGPHGQLASTWSCQTLPWASTYEALGNADTRFLVAKTSKYFAEFRPLMQKWGAMVYDANAPQNQNNPRVFIPAQQQHPRVFTPAHQHPMPVKSPQQGHLSLYCVVLLILAQQILRYPLQHFTSLCHLRSPGEKKKNMDDSDDSEEAMRISTLPTLSLDASEEEGQALIQILRGSTQGQGGHADQLKKTGKTLAAPARKGRKETNLDISDAEENPMAPSQLRKLKKNATTKSSLTGSSNPTQCSIGINKNVHSGHQQPNSGHNILAHLSEQPQVQLSLQPTSTGSQNIRKASWSNERTRDSEEEAGDQAPEHGIGDDDDQDQDQTDRGTEKRDGAQDQEQTLEIGDTTDFRQHEDNLYGEYGGEAQEDGPSQGISIKVLMGILTTSMALRTGGFHDDFNYELNDAARDETEETRPPKLCPIYTPFFLLHALSPFYTLKVSIWAFSITSYTRISVCPPHAVSSSAPSIQGKKKHKAKTVQEDPTKLGFYPPAWQAFLQAIIEMRYNLCKKFLTLNCGCTTKKIKLDNGYFPQYTTQMSWLLCDDLFTFRTELKKVVISITKASYNIFPKGTMARKDEVKKCVIVKATKLLKTGDYLHVPDSSNGKWKNFVSQALRDGCLKFYYGNSKKALKSTDKFRCAIPVNGLLLVGAVSLTNQQTKGVLTGFHETGTDKVPDLSTDKCRADFDLLQRSVDALLKIPDCRVELEEMLEQWAMIGAGDLDFDKDNTGGSDMKDVNIIL
ncbi:uncharacterized protein EDB93DRAFT_1109314 [Suillus bovinus]|uniref:uncharacterized protein n=1 Tax=Suillus bovinus TaxID=48563 RepID=UPI001B86D9E5|nr:uncharacterized protein EDB93DRAFT_1109314 [Suillus bovinus]KAG2127298.1 hypothetical protein EDB93DRAFT_1109314 [Suillus bovinus]